MANDFDLLWAELREIRTKHEQLVRSLGTYASLQLQLVAQVDALDGKVAATQRLLDGMTRSDEIADAVAQRLRSDRQRGWTLLQKTAVTVAGLLGLASTLHGLGAW